MDDLIEFDAERGLDLREYTLISRIHQISVWLAKHSKRRKVVDLIKEEYEVTAAEAEVWVRKAEDFMTLGVMEGVASAKQVYNMRLQKIFDLCMANAQRDVIEVTTKPTKLVDVDGEIKTVSAQHTKVKVNALDNAAIATALKAAREMARLNGVQAERPSININNMQVNTGPLPPANVVSDLANKQLAELAGLESIIDVEVLSETTDTGEGDTAGGDGVDQAPEADREG